MKSCSQGQKTQSKLLCGNTTARRITCRAETPQYTTQNLQVLVSAPRPTAVLCADDYSRFDRIVIFLLDWPLGQYAPPHVLEMKSRQRFILRRISTSLSLHVNLRTQDILFAINGTLLRTMWENHEIEDFMVGCFRDFKAPMPSVATRLDVIFGRLSNKNSTTSEITMLVDEPIQLPRSLRPLTR